MCPASETKAQAIGAQGWGGVTMVGGGGESMACVGPLSQEKEF